MRSNIDAIGTLDALTALLEAEVGSLASDDSELTVISVELVMR